MRLEAHILCWNEAPLVPYVMDYWKRAEADKIYIYDNGSTDGSQELLSQYSNVEIIPFDSNGVTDEYVLTNLRNTKWKTSRGSADWVIICDFDEVPYCEGNLKDYLATKNAALKTKMHQLVSETFPEYNPDTLMHQAEGMRYYDADTTMDKTLTFPVKGLADINFNLGAHFCHPLGVGTEKYPEGLCFFHLKYLGRDYVLNKSRRLYENLRPDIRKGGTIDIHYKRHLDNYDKIFNDMWNKSIENN